jgi:hypothetical protein
VATAPFAWTESFHAVRRCLCPRKGAETSLRNLCLAGCTTFMGSLSENIGFCAPQVPGALAAHERQSLGRARTEDGTMAPPFSDRERFLNR